MRSSTSFSERSGVSKGGPQYEEEPQRGYEAYVTLHNSRPPSLAAQTISLKNEAHATQNPQNRSPSPLFYVQFDRPSTFLHLRVVAHVCESGGGVRVGGGLAWGGRGDRILTLQRQNRIRLAAADGTSHCWEYRFFFFSVKNRPRPFLSRRPAFTASISTTHTHTVKNIIITRERKPPSDF